MLLFAILFPEVVIAAIRVIGLFLCGALCALCALLGVFFAVIGSFPLTLLFVVLACVCATPFRRK